MKKFIYAVMLLLCMSIVGCQKESTTRPSSYPLVKKIVVNSAKNTWSVSFEYDSKGRIINLNHDGENTTIDYEHYSNGEGLIKVTDGAGKYTFHMKNGLCQTFVGDAPNPFTDKFEYDGSHLISWDNILNYSWSQDLIVHRESEVFHPASYEYEEVNPFAEQQMNMTEYLMFGVSGNIPNLLGFCGIESKKLIKKETVALNLSEVNETSFNYRYENGIITEIHEVWEGQDRSEIRTYYIEYN